MDEVFDSIRDESRTMSEKLTTRRVRQYRIRTTTESGSFPKQTLMYVGILYIFSTTFTSSVKVLRKVWGFIRNTRKIMGTTNHLTLFPPASSAGEGWGRSFLRNS